MEMIKPVDNTFLDSSFEEFVDNLADVFEESDVVEFGKPLTDEEFRLLEDLEIPEGKTLYINPSEISFDNLNEFREFILGNPGLKLIDSYGHPLDLNVLLESKNVSEYVKDVLGKKMTPSGEVEDISA